MEQLTIVVNIITRTDPIKRVRARLEKLITITFVELGNLQYDLHLYNENPAYLIFYENRESRELRQTQTYYARLRKRGDPRVYEIEIG